MRYLLYGGPAHNKVMDIPSSQRDLYLNSYKHSNNALGSSAVTPLINIQTHHYIKTYLTDGNQRIVIFMHHDGKRFYNVEKMANLAKRRKAV